MLEVHQLLTATGSIPTGTRATTLRLAIRMTSTVSAGVLATNTWPPATAMGEAWGLRKVG